MLTQVQKDKIVSNIVQILNLAPNSKRTNIFICSKFEQTADEEETVIYLGYTHHQSGDFLKAIEPYARDGKGVRFALQQLQNAGLKTIDVQVLKYQPKRSNYPRVRINVVPDWTNFDEVDYLHTCRPILVEE